MSKTARPEDKMIVLDRAAYHEGIQRLESQLEAADVLLEKVCYVLSIPWDDDFDDVMVQLRRAAKRYEGMRP